MVQGEPCPCDSLEGERVAARHVVRGCGDDVHLAARDRDVGARVTNRAPWGICGRLNETGDAFAGGEWPEIGSFVRAEVSAVSGEVVGGCCEAAVAPISAKKLAQQEWILEQTAKKFALQAKKR